MHFVGIDRPAAGDGTPVDVEVRATAKPVVLVLTSSMSALWNVKLTKDARLKAVIIGGYDEQEFEGIPANVPIVYRAYFPSENRRFFYAYKPNTREYRRTLEKLNDMTGLLVSTFQGGENGASFVVDGMRGQELTQKEPRVRRRLPKEPTSKELLAACKDAELDVVSIYFTGPGNNGSPVAVEVRSTAKPVVLVLSSYMSALWNVKIAPGGRLKAVIIGGYYEQEFEGIPANVPVVYRAFFPSRKYDHFYGHEWNTPDCQRMVEQLNDMTDLPVTSFQGEYLSTSFIVESIRGSNFAQRERIVKKQPNPEEDPNADVADIPSQDLQASGDANKRYFLIGPTKNAKPPAKGYGLVVIMPGGDGSDDFNPFVRRIYKRALSDQYLVAQPVAVQWTDDQEIVWPTKTDPVEKMKFSTEEFVEAAIEDVAKKHNVDRKRVFTLSWSSSGPAAYAISLQDKHSIAGSFVAMSVFLPKTLPPLKAAKGHPYYLYHSREDSTCRYQFAEQAKTSLTANGAKVHLQTFKGGHTWANGHPFEDIRQGIEWLEKNRETAGMP
jgi:predicted esterase